MKDATLEDMARRSYRLIVQGEVSDTLQPAAAEPVPRSAGEVSLECRRDGRPGGADRCWIK
jgi:hypothetical protein